MLIQKSIPISELKNLKIEFFNKNYIVTLIDKQNFEIIKGDGLTIVEAINDLHSNLF